jgi:hypothetical protein
MYSKTKELGKDSSLEISDVIKEVIKQYSDSV